MSSPWGSGPPNHFRSGKAQTENEFGALYKCQEAADSNDFAVFLIMWVIIKMCCS